MELTKHKIVVRPISTEKSSGLKKQNKYVFQVHPKAKKIEIRKAISDLFKVEVIDVNTSKVKGKFRRVGKYTGKKPDWKKAVVTLKEGNTIKVVEEV